MKKILVVLLTVILIFSLFSLTAFADEDKASQDFINNLPAPDADTHMRVTGLTRSGELVLIEDNPLLYNGWNTAVENASPSKLEKNGFIAVVVDFYYDWKGGSHGVFCDYGEGFKWDTIYVPEDSRMILNLNGHYIDRELTEWENNGEVMCIDENATVIINGGSSSKDKTEGAISGGYSAQFGGGIHIKEGANVILNNINVTGNRVEDASGAGISVAEGATLTMNGGSISNNKLAWTYQFLFFNTDNQGVGVYASKNSTLNFNDVDFKNNLVEGGEFTVEGSAIYARSGSDITINNCYFEGNGIHTEKNMPTKSLIVAEVNSDVTIKDTVFKKNGNVLYSDAGTGGVTTSLLRLRGNVLIDNCTFEENHAGSMISIMDASIELKDTTITNNTAINLFRFTYNPNKDGSIISGCTFKDNIQKTSWTDMNYGFIFENMKKDSNFIFTSDNVFGDEITFNSKEHITFLTDGNEKVGSIFGDGSFAVILAIASLIISILAIAIIFIDKKNKDRLPSAEESSSAKD